VKLVGFGCSFTYGSELIDPELAGVWDETSDSAIWDRHYKNIPWRTSNCWLGLLAKYNNCEVDNLAEPANSNMAIAQQVTNYFNTTRNPNEKIVICVAWTERTRFSWYDKTWTHNGFVKDSWTSSCKDWVVRSTNDSHDMWTNNAKLIVNSVCKAHNISVLQFNALGTHATTNLDNYFIDGFSMDSMLKRAEQEDKRLKLFAEGGHPNEAGHEYFTKRLHLFAKEHIIL
jgi:hypothetical protein|tara:strand:+ start:3681 stop:4367 length:687 start_codon:yes stop_codon:yes gene_type:complete